MSLRTLSASVLAGVLSPLKTATFLLGGIAVAIVITGCSPAEPKKNEPEQQTSSAAGASSESQKAAVNTTAPTPPTETVPTPKTQTAVPGWESFNAKYFNLSFEFPQNFTIEEGPNIIFIAAPQPTPEPYGTTHQFFELWRYTGSKTKTSEIENARTELMNLVQDSVVVDGTIFVRITGYPFSTINGKKEQLGQNKLQYVFFEKSYIVIFGGHVDLTSGQDAIALANQIISTMKFSSTAR